MLSGFGVFWLAVLSVLHCSAWVQCTGEPDRTDDADGEFALSAYCKSMCQWGHGGNLCNCHAAYFAGKRSTAGEQERKVLMLASSSAGSVDRGRSPDDDGDVWIALAAERRPASTKSSAADLGDGERTEEDDVERRWWTAGTEELRRHLRSAASSSNSVDTAS